MPDYFEFLQIFFIIGCLQISFGDEGPPKDYAKLELNAQELKGSRWALEQSQKVTVYHSFEIVDIVKVDTNDMSVRIEFHVKQRWDANGLDLPPGLFKETDPKGVFISADENVLRSVWSPDSFIPNARDTRILAAATPHSVVNIFANKTIVFKARMYAVLGCSFTFNWYPLDIQICDLIFESHKYTKAVVEYDWEPNKVNVSSEIILYQYDLKIPVTTSKGYHERWGGKFSYPFVKIRLKFERKLGNNVIQIFIPTILVVTLSFFSFWLGLDAVPGRVSLLITCILTLVTLHSGLKGSIPNVHYIKMIDIWMIGCMAFVFGAICEFVLIKYMKWRTTQIKTAQEEKEKYLRQQEMLRIESSFPMGVPMQPPPGINYKNEKMMHNMHHPMPNAVPPPPPEYNQLQESYYENYYRKRVSHPMEKRDAPWQSQTQANGFGANPGMYPGPGMGNMHQIAIYDRQPMVPLTPPPSGRPLWVKIERVCRVLFPLLFIAFNGAFWPILITGSAKQHQDV